MDHRGQVIDLFPKDENKETEAVRLPFLYSSVFMYGGLAGLHVFVERLADGTGTGVEFLDVALDLFAEACLIEVEAEDVLAAVELVQRTPVLIGLANLERGDDGLQL